MSGLRVLQAGWSSLLVDRGRPTGRSWGVPAGGAADRAALTLGNTLVGNPPDALALEISLTGPTLEALTRTHAVVFGVPLQLTGDRHSFQPGATFTLEAGEVLRIGGTPTGLRAYLCVAGGFDGPAVLGSRSGLEPVCAGLILACPPSHGPVRWPGEELTSVWTVPPEIFELRCLDGPQADWFEPEAFGGQIYTVTPASNRMGLRIRGAPLKLPGRELVSEPVAPGSVQVTNDGQCIILGVDGQTIGGYPKVAHVISADLDLLGRVRPGDRIRFRRVTLDEAESLAADRRAWLESWRARLAIAVGAGR